jgi:hypothetical protein
MNKNSQKEQVQLPFIFLYSTCFMIDEEQQTEWLALLLRIRDVPGSYLGQEVFRGFLSPSRQIPG